MAFALPSGAILTAVLLAAGQAPPQIPPQTTTPPNVAKPKATTPDEGAPRTTQEKITITGCIARGDASGAQAAGGPLVLKASSGAASDRSSSGGTPAGTHYQIVSNDPALRLADHVGHRVQLTGRLQAEATEPPSRTNQGVSTSTPSGSTGMETMPPAGDKPEPRRTPTAAATDTAVPATFVVTGVQMLSGSCEK